MQFIDADGADSGRWLGLVLGHLATPVPLLSACRRGNKSDDGTGRRSGPPEDVGGPYNYPDFLDAIADPDHEEHEHDVEWLGDGFDPEAFDLAEVNERLGDIIRE